jgi:ribosomal protein S18 acetylase RimI-like enzyme
MTSHPSGGPVRDHPTLGVDPATMRFLDLHEARAHAVGGREVRDLGDAILLHDAQDRDTFWNRLSWVALPDDPGAFDARLAELLALFAGLDRRPHVWEAPIHQRPADLGRRLGSHGFRDLGGGLLMVQVDPAALAAAPDAIEGVTLERHRLPGERLRDRLADETAGLLVAAFRVDPFVRPRLTIDMARSLEAPELHLYLARVGGTAVAVAKRLSFDDASYLSSIGTRPGWQGRGLGAMVTAAACRDAAEDGDGWTYLGVFESNRRARTLYERLGFAALGGPGGDFLLG